MLRIEIWTEEGSPLVVSGQNVQKKLQERVKVPVELAMRYQNPSIPSAVRKLAAQGVDDLLLIPLFPHYAMSSFETAVERVKELAANLAPTMRITVQPPFYKDPDYISALVVSAEEYLKKGYDLKDRASEVEKLYIESHYYDDVTLDFEKAGSQEPAFLF